MRIIVLILILFGIVACKRSVPSDTEGQVIRVADSCRMGQVDLYDWVDSVSYLPLETSDRILLGDILGAKRAGDRYFVQDNKGLFAFDDRGRFVCEIGHRGQGPGEYYNLDCFYLDRGRKLVCIVSNVQRKIFRYTFDGTLHSTWSLDKSDANLSSVMVCSDEELLAHFPLPNQAKPADREYALLFCHDNQSESVKLLDAPKVHSGVAFHPLLYYPMAFFLGRPFFISAFSNRLYTLEKGRAVVEYVVDLPGLVPDADFWKAHEEMELFQLRKLMQEQHIGMGITAIEAADGYLFLSVNNRETLVWDGATGWLIGRVYDASLGRFSNLLLSGGVSDEHLGVLQADFLYQNRERLRAGSNRQLASIAARIAEDDNPVLYRYHFKKR